MEARYALGGLRAHTRRLERVMHAVGTTTPSRRRHSGHPMDKNAVAFWYIYICILIARIFDCSDKLRTDKFYNIFCNVVFELLACACGGGAAGSIICVDTASTERRNQ